MNRLSLMGIGLGLLAFAAGLVIDTNLGRIVENGTLVQSAEAARRVSRHTSVRRGPVRTVRRTTVRTPKGVYRKKTVRRTGGYYRGGRWYPYAPGRVAARRIIRTGVYLSALPAGCYRVNQFGYAVWRCGGVYYQPYGGRYVVVRF